jgi:hypothetical protein
MSIDPELRRFASARDLEILDALDLHQSGRKAAVALGLKSEGTIRDAIRRLRARAAVQGYSPESDMRRVAPEPFVVKGTSTYYDKEGAVRGQWVKTKLDDERRGQMIMEAAVAMAEQLPKMAPTPPPVDSQNDLCNLYVLTDVHIGMLASQEEGGADWSTEVAEQVIESCFSMMVDRAPAASHAVVAQLGDFLHFDGMKAITPNSGHVLDADNRFPQVIRAAVRLLRKIVAKALANHENVTLLIAEGNHDEASSQWLQVMFAAIMENEPRLNVIVSAKPYYAFQHGSTALFFHHGHKQTGAGLALLLAAEFREIWGKATRAYAHVGHRHSVEEKDHPGIRVIQHPTLAARDSHASRGGWLSDRQASAITYHREYGEVGRVVVVPGMT